MKKNILSILLAFACMGLKAQITILNSDMPKVNDTLRYSIADGTGLDFVTSGLNTTWDFSILKPTGQDVEKYNSPLSSAYIIYFSGATYGIKETGLNLGALSGLGGGIASSFSNVMSFYKNTATASVLMGRGATYSGLPLGLTLTSKDTVYKFPLTIGKTDSCFFEGNTSLASVGALKQMGVRKTIVDGWGTIKTPYGQFACIRVKSVIKEVDTITVSGLNIPIPNNRTEYKWLAKNEKFPILEVVVTQGTLGVGGTTTVRYKDIYRAEAFVNNANFTASKLATIIGDTVNLMDNSAGSPTAYQWTITPNTVSYTGGTTATSQNPRVLFTANGQYSVKLHVTYQGGSDDTLKTNYINITGGTNIGLKEIKSAPVEVSIYPVPASNELNITFSKSVKNTSILVFDILGKEREIESTWSKSNTVATLDINTLQNGVYFVRMLVDGKEVSKRFIKE